MKSFLAYLLESDNTIKQYDASNKAIKILASALEAVKDRYIKCLSVLTLFDNQAGNIAELILVELLNEYSASHRDAIKCNLSATQEGGNQALTDISVKVDDEIINISLKNSALNNTIKLGTDTKEKSSSRITKTDMEDSAKTLTTLFNASSKQSWQFPVFNTLEKLQSLTKSKYDSLIDKTNAKNEFPTFEEISNTTDIIKRRINAIITKLCGTTDKAISNQSEVFCICEKNEKPLILDNGKKIKYIAGLNIRMFKFNPEKLYDIFKKEIITTTKGKTKYGSWSIGNYIAADNTMMLNISHDFILAHAESDLLNLVKQEKLLPNIQLDVQDNIEKQLKKFKSALNANTVLKLKSDFVKTLETMFDSIMDQNKL